MKGKFNNLLDKKFGRLLVLERLPRKNKRTMWRCRCDCGNYKTTRSENLTRFLTKSCGCLQKEKVYKTGKENLVHNMCKTQFYKKYSGIKRRCENIKDPNYFNYGNRGIKCLWGSFIEFRDDMYESYQAHVKEFGEKNTTIDRIDNNGNYCRENCRWATYKIQERNKRNNRFFTFEGKSLSIPEWTEIYSIKKEALRARLNKYKWSIKDALTKEKWGRPTSLRQ